MSASVLPRFFLSRTSTQLLVANRGCSSCSRRFSTLLRLPSQSAGSPGSASSLSRYTQAFHSAARSEPVPPSSAPSFKSHTLSPQSAPTGPIVFPQDRQPRGATAELEYPSEHRIPTQSPDSKSTATSSDPSPQPTRRRSRLRPRKAAITLTPAAVEKLHLLLSSPDPKLIRVGVRNRGCSGLAYHLEYVDKPGKFDEMVEQDGVKVLVDSKALFSIIGSEMDWHEDPLTQKFVFRNPNITEECGCGESFSV